MAIHEGRRGEGLPPLHVLLVRYTPSTTTSPPLGRDATRLPRETSGAGASLGTTAAAGRGTDVGLRGRRARAAGAAATAAATSATAAIRSAKAIRVEVLTRWVPSSGASRAGLAPPSRRRTDPPRPMRPR